MQKNSRERLGQRWPAFSGRRFLISSCALTCHQSAARSKFDGSKLMHKLGVGDVADETQDADILLQVPLNIAPRVVFAASKAASRSASLPLATGLAAGAAAIGIVL